MRWRSASNAAKAVRHALAEWLAEEQRRYELTLEALKDVDEGRLIDHADVSESLKRT
jgi:predicted transcriptional regulator